MRREKDFEMEVRLRNNHLKRRRRALGLTQGQLAERVGISLQVYCTLETMSLSPRGARVTWILPATKLAKFYRTAEEDLFPDAVLSVAKSSAVREIDGAEAFALLGSGAHELAESASDVYDRAELRVAASRALACLSAREEVVLRHKFGFGRAGDRSAEELGAVVGVGPDQVRSIATKALRRVRRGSRDVLREFAGPEQEESESDTEGAIE